MELRTLRYFLAVAKEGSFTKAANVLHVTQPTLSRQLKELEEELNTDLFVRHSHSVSLTEDGMRLLRRAEEIVDIVRKTRDEFVGGKNNIQGDIYIGAGETAAVHTLARVVADIRHDYPKIHTHIFSGNGQELIERLENGLLDFALLIEPINLSRFEYLELNESDTWGVWVPKDDVLAQKEAIEREDLLDKPLLLSRQAIAKTSGNNDFVAWFGNAFDRLNIVATYNLVYNAAVFAENNIGYLVSLKGLYNGGDTSSLLYKHLSPKLESKLVLAWKRNPVFSPAAQLFLVRLRELLAQSRD